MNTNLAIIPKLTRDQAFAKIGLIRGEINLTTKSMARLRELVIEFDEGMGWEAMGYANLSECFEKQLGKSFQQGYRQLNAALVERNILSLLPSGEIPARVIPERHIRDTGISKLEPEAQAAAYANAQNMAKAEGLTEPTTEHVTRAVQLEATKTTVFQSPYTVVSHMVATGSATVETGRQMVTALDRLTPKQRGYIVQLIAKFGMNCPALFAPIAGMFDRRPGKESKVLPEVLSGFLGGTALNKATVSDLNKANYEAQRQHQAEAEAARLAAGGAEPVMVTLYKGDIKRSIKVMYQEFGWIWMLQFFWMICTEAWVE